MNKSLKEIQEDIPEAKIVNLPGRIFGGILERIFGSYPGGFVGGIYWKYQEDILQGISVGENLG